MAPREAVLLATARPVDAAAAGAAIAGALGLALPDAVRRARYGGGIVGEDLEPEAAAALVRALEAAGIGARRIAAAGLPALPRPRRAVRARVGEDALELTLGPLGPELALKWSEIRLVLPFAVAARRAAPPQEGEGAKKPRVPLADAAHGLSPECAQLAAALAKEPARIGLDAIGGGTAVRVWRDEFAFGPESGLPEGSPSHSLERFLLFARLLLARAVRAPEPPEAAALLGAGLLEPALFADENELVRYERWWLARGI